MTAEDRHDFELRGGASEAIIRPMSSPSRVRERLLAAGLISLPLAGLVLVLAVPGSTSTGSTTPRTSGSCSARRLNFLLGLVASEAARQRDDARLFLVSMALLASAGFLALHALATPGVLLPGPNAGFVMATPVGLLVAWPSPRSRRWT